MLISIKGSEKLIMNVSYFEQNKNCYIEAECSEIQLNDTFSRQNFKDALLSLRKIVEPQGYKIACNGCLKNVVYSGQLLSSGKGLTAYIVTDICKPVDLSQVVRTLNPVDESLWKELATINEQRAFKKLYTDKAMENADQWAKEAERKKFAVLDKQKKSSIFNKRN